MQYRSESPADTEKIAISLLRKIDNKKPFHATVIALEGELGAGKTTFVKGIAQAFKIKQNITSPTFVIMKAYKLRPLANHNFSKLIHIDAYRLKDYRDLASLGVKEIFDDPKNIVLIEWSDRVQKILPKKHIKVHLDHLTEFERKITIDE